MKKITRKALATILSAALLISCISTAMIFTSAEDADRTLTVNVTKNFDTALADDEIAYIGMGFNEDGSDKTTPNDPGFAPTVLDGKLVIPAITEVQSVFTFSDLYDQTAKTATVINGVEFDLYLPNTNNSVGIITMYTVDSESNTVNSSNSVAGTMGRVSFTNSGNTINASYSTYGLGNQNGWYYTHDGSRTSPSEAQYDYTYPVHIKIEGGGATYYTISQQIPGKDLVTNTLRLQSNQTISNPFNFAIYNTGSSVYLDNLTYSYTKDYSTDSEVTAFLTDNEEILAKTVDTVTANDEAAVNKALADYSAITDINKQKVLEAEKSLLDSLAEKVAELKAMASAKDAIVKAAKNSLAENGCYTSDMDYAADFVDISESKVYTPKKEFTIPGVLAKTVTGTITVGDTSQIDIYSNYGTASGRHLSLYWAGSNFSGRRMRPDGDVAGMANEIGSNLNIVVGTTFTYTITYKQTGTKYYDEITLTSEAGSYTWSGATGGTVDYTYAADNVTTFAIMASGSNKVNDFTVNYGDILPEMQGASVLLNAETIEGQNLRFDAIIPEGSSDFYTYKRSGMVIMMEYYLNGQELVKDVASNLENRQDIVAKTIDCPEVTPTEDGNHIYLEVKGTGLVSNTDSNFYGYGFCARAYSVYEDAAGNEIYVYATNNYSYDVQYNTDKATDVNETVSVIKNGVSTSSVTRVMRNIAKSYSTNYTRPTDAAVLEAIGVTSGTTKEQVLAMYEYNKATYQGFIAQ